MYKQETHYPHFLVGIQTCTSSIHNVPGISEAGNYAVQNILIIIYIIFIVRRWFNSSVDALDWNLPGHRAREQRGCMDRKK